MGDILTIDNVTEETVSDHLDETKEICLELCFSFYGEFESMYLRRNLQSNLAHIVIHSENYYVIISRDSFSDILYIAFIN